MLTSAPYLFKYYRSPEASLLRFLKTPFFTVVDTMLHSFQTYHMVIPQFRMLRCAPKCGSHLSRRTLLEYQQLYSLCSFLPRSIRSIPGRLYLPLLFTHCAQPPIFLPSGNWQLSVFMDLLLLFPFILFLRFHTYMKSRFKLRVIASLQRASLTCGP